MALFNAVLSYAIKHRPVDHVFSTLDGDRNHPPNRVGFRIIGIDYRSWRENPGRALDIVRKDDRPRSPLCSPAESFPTGFFSRYCSMTASELVVILPPL